MNYDFEERPTWRWWVTPKPLKEKAVHRWFVFPHSFTSELVHALIEEWGLGSKDYILDPFVGAGTTILAAKEKGVPASGYDLSPLAVHAARTKITNYNVARLEEAWEALKPMLDPARWNGATKTYAEMVLKALPGRLLGAFETVARQIDNLPYLTAERDFFRLALLASLPYYSRAVATGGWLKWVDRRTRARSLPSVLTTRLEEMLDDLRVARLPSGTHWQVELADARRLPDHNSIYSAVITSPPYPNRHDYTRVFGVELMFGFFNWEETRKLRYQSFESHPEARPERPEANGYVQPKALRRVIGRLDAKGIDRRIPAMLDGYFLDMYLCLREVKRVCQRGARIAFVVGNAQYCGESIFVDELTAEVGEQAGLTCEKLLVTRYRGNSAQQMGKYRRNPSRESVVIFRK